MTQKNWWFFPIILILTLFLFGSSLNYYFFQDDWFVLNWIRTGNFASFFSFRTDIIYWRPLSMPLFFAFAKSIFGLNAFGFHLISFSIFLLLILSVYKLFQILLADTKVAKVAALLYATWPIHFLSLSWLSTTTYVISPFLQTLSFIFFIKFAKHRRLPIFVASFLTFILALASSEMALVLPALFFLWGLFFKKKALLKPLLPFAALILVYLLLRLFIFPIPAIDAYQPYFNFRIATNFAWYVLWAFGIPEKFKELIFFSQPERAIKTLMDYRGLTIPIFLLISSITVKLLQNLKRKNWKFPLLGFTWLVLGLLPVITLTDHSLPVYLSFSGIGFLLIVASSLKKSKTSTVTIIMILWLLASFLNLRFTKSNHWANNEQAISKAYSEYTLKSVPQAQDNSVFVFWRADADFSKANNFVLVESEDQVRQSLNNMDAMQVLYNNSKVKSFYPALGQKLEIWQGVAVYDISPSIRK